MKKTLKVFIMVVLAIMFFFVSCDNELIITHKVTFNSNGGSDVSAVEVKDGNKVTKPSDPIKTGYDFVKWTTDEAGESEYDFDSAVTVDITLYAKWIKVHTVTFNAGDGKPASQSLTVKNGNVIDESKITKPTRTGYTLKGWYNGENKFEFGTTTVTNDLSLVAVWEEIDNTYTITYTIGDGATQAKDNPKEYKRYAGATENKEVTISGVPTNPGYIFEGWKLSGTDDSTASKTYTISADTVGEIELVAVWRPLEKGDTVKLGTVEWQVVSVDTENSCALLISRKVLEPREFDDYKEGDQNDYGKSQIRQYLNNTEDDKGFFKKYGLSTEYMKKVDVTSSLETTTLTYSGSDYVFLLSKTEVTNTSYFEDSDAQKDASSSEWWLRSPYNEKFVYTVGTGGGLSTSSWPNNYRGVRPAFWYTWTEDVCNKYTISYENGEDVVAGQSNPVSYTRYKDSTKNTEVSISEAPTKPGHIFIGWKLGGTEDNTAVSTYTITTESTGDIKLVAVWRERTAGDKISEVGEIIKLGTVTWQAISVDEENKYALLISENVLENRKFDANVKPYGDSDIHGYLVNTEQDKGFFKVYGLSTTYMKKIERNDTTTKPTDSGSEYVFLLSENEANTYFGNDAARIAKLGSVNSTWWLRTTYGGYGLSALVVNEKGEIKKGTDVTAERGLHPAFWYTWK